MGYFSGYFGPTVVPNAADLRKGISLGGVSGLLDLPPENDVKLGVFYDNGTKVGTAVLEPGGFDPQQPKAPLITPSHSPYKSFIAEITVMLFSNENAAIIYTLDGKIPVVGVSPIYHAPLQLRNNTIVTAIAVIAGRLSQASRAQYIRSDISPTR